MKRCFLLLSMVLLLVTCKKKTTINVSLFNPALNEFVSGATIALVERADKMGGTECREIATAVTDAEGRAFFDKEKLRWEDKYEYFCAVTESWGIQQSYPCGKYMPKFISKGKDQDWEMWDEQSGLFGLEYFNLLSPSQTGDSLRISVYFHQYTHPKSGTQRGGTNVFGNAILHGDKQYPYPPYISTQLSKCVGGIYTATIRKIKMGIVTETKQEFKVIPNQTFRLKIEW